MPAAFSDALLEIIRDNQISADDVPLKLTNEMLACVNKDQVRFGACTLLTDEHIRSVTSQSRVWQHVYIHDEIVSGQATPAKFMLTCA